MDLHEKIRRKENEYWYLKGKKRGLWGRETDADKRRFETLCKLYEKQRKIKETLT